VELFKLRKAVMSRICQLTGKRAMVGNNVSHSNRKTKRRFNANIQTKRIYVREVDMYIKVKVSAKALRTMDKLGVYNFLKRQLEKGFDPFVWVENPNAKISHERGYRRVENVDKNGNKTYSVTYEPENEGRNRKVKLSTIIK
jgi:large subunit ribosomal protein L28